LRIRVARKGAAYETLDVPAEFRKIPGSPRDPDANPYQAFRYDQDFEFIEAIHAGRPCVPSFVDGLRAQIVMEAIIRSAREQRTVDVPQL
jgi:predicted dehydrogenase